MLFFSRIWIGSFIVMYSAGAHKKEYGPTSLYAHMQQIAGQIGVKPCQHVSTLYQHIRCDTMQMIWSLRRPRGEKSQVFPRNPGGKLPRGESQSVWLFTGKRNRSSLPPCTVIWEPVSHKCMPNDSIYSPHLYLFISASIFHLTALPICTSTFLHPLVELSDIAKQFLSQYTFFISVSNNSSWLIKCWLGRFLLDWCLQKPRFHCSVRFKNVYFKCILK